MIKVELLDRFDILNETDKSSIELKNFDLIQHIDPPLFFIRSAQLLGLELNLDILGSGNSLSLSTSISSESSSMSDLSGPEAFPDSAHAIARQFLHRGVAAAPLPMSFVKSIKARTKYLHRVSFEEGTALTRLALSKLKSNQTAKARTLLASAIQRFKECWDIKPNDHRALYNWALAIATEAELQSDPMVASIMWKEVADKYVRNLFRFEIYVVNDYTTRLVSSIDLTTK